MKLSQYWQLFQLFKLFGMRSDKPCKIPYFHAFAVWWICLFHCFLALFSFSLAQDSLKSSQCFFTTKTALANKCKWEVSGHLHQDQANDSALFFRGHWLRGDEKSNTVLATIRSPLIASSWIHSPKKCFLQLTLGSNFFRNIEIAIILEEKKHHSKDIHRIKAFTSQNWSKRIFIGGSSRDFNVLIEIIKIRENLPIQKDVFIAFKALQFVGCTKEETDPDHCVFKCELHNQESNSLSNCVNRDQICDLHADCQDSSDEHQNCDKLPNGALMPFLGSSLDEYGWFNTRSVKWIVNSGKVVANFASPDSMESAEMQSPVFSALPSFHSTRSSKYYSSCKLRLSYLLGFHNAHLKITIAELARKGNTYFGNQEGFLSLRNLKPKKVQTLLEDFQRHFVSEWKKVQIALPVDIRGHFRLLVTASVGILHNIPLSEYRSVQIANLSLSKECFSIDVPSSERKIAVEIDGRQQLHLPIYLHNLNHIKHHKFIACKSQGSQPPTQQDCEHEYKLSNLSTKVQVSSTGIQKWTVPETGFYTIFAAGGSGGHGSSFNATGGNGAFVRAVFYFEEGEELRILVGQHGDDVCAYSQDSFTCDKRSWAENGEVRAGGGGGGATIVYTVDKQTFLDASDAQTDSDLLYRLQQVRKNPLLIVGGGGGGGSSSNAQFNRGEPGKSFDDIFFYYSNLLNDPQSEASHAFSGSWNHSLRPSLKPVDGSAFVKLHFDFDVFFPVLDHVNMNRLLNTSLTTNQSFKKFGGSICSIKEKFIRLEGGFGGGGGSCDYGGGGSGFQPGFGRKNFGGTGGSSFYDPNKALFPAFHESNSEFDWPNKELNSPKGFLDSRNGFVLIVPQISECCSKKKPCLILNGAQGDSGDLQTLCICSHDNFQPKSCSFTFGLVFYVFTFIFILLIIICLMALLYHYYFRGFIRFKVTKTNGQTTLVMDQVPPTELQLSLLRTGKPVVSEFNPNYEVNPQILGPLASSFELLPQIKRERIMLRRQLGKGAFGEVFEALLFSEGEGMKSDCNVAAKVLPEYPAYPDAELDFLLEALIMVKFNHRNVVRLLGVCFDSMPRFIILELLEGGDLRGFLRTNRGNKKKGALCMGDLLVFALDIARGCEYLAEHHFVHRDVATRNCLLTQNRKNLSSNNPPKLFSSELTDQMYLNGYNNSGIIAKISDFGMARDIYSHDFYKKGGRVMIPVKWMPPESFLDAVFTSKTDVWGYGIFLWEVFSLGFMPYPGKSNQEVMQLVISGGRLEKPNSACPDLVYELMKWCWASDPKQRPTFNEICKFLAKCLSEPHILEMALPRFSANNSQSNSAESQSGDNSDKKEFKKDPIIQASQSQQTFDDASGENLIPKNRQKIQRKVSLSRDVHSPDTCSTALTTLSSTAHTSSQTSEPRSSVSSASAVLPGGVVKIRGSRLNKLGDLLRKNQETGCSWANKLGAVKFLRGSRKTDHQILEPISPIKKSVTPGFQNKLPTPLEHSIEENSVEVLLRPNKLTEERKKRNMPQNSAV